MCQSIDPTTGERIADEQPSNHWFFRARLPETLGYLVTVRGRGYESKSRHENLENEAKYGADYWERQRAKDELHRVQSDRYRDNMVAAAVNTQNQAQQQANVRAQRGQSGSRFNVRYDSGFPEGATTARGIMNALSQYVDFGATPATAAGPRPGSTASAPALRKGLTVVQVEQMLGPAAKVSQRTEGSIEMTMREYATESERIVAQFVGGVLVDYSITPRG